MSSQKIHQNAYSKMCKKHIAHSAYYMRPSNMRLGVYVINNFNTKVRMKVQYILHIVIYKLISQ